MKLIASVVLLCTIGCQAWRVDPDSGNGDSDGTDPADSLRGRLGCLPGSDAFIGVDLERSEHVSTVHTARWETAEALSAWVVTDVGREEFLESPVAEDAATSGEILVLGIPAMTPAELVVVAESAEGLLCSEVQAVEVGALPVELPALVLGARDPEQAAGGFTVLSVLLEGPGYAVAIDEYGSYTWFVNILDYTADKNVAMNRAVFSRNEPSILFMTWARSADDMAVVYRVGLDGVLLETVEIPGSQKDFVELPDGSFAAIGWDIREFENPDGETVRLVGDHLIEVSPEGESRILWSAFDTWSPDLSLDYPSGGYPADHEALDWSHVNGIDYDSEEDAYLVSVFGMGSVIKIDRQTGEPLWIMANTTGDFSSSSAEALIQGTHSVELLGDDRVLVFNRNINNPFQDEETEYDNRCSEALEIELDPSTGEAIRSWSYTGDDCLLVVYFGEARRLDNGNTMVIFSSSGQVNEATPEGETVWQVNTDIGGAFGFGDRVGSLY